MSSKGCALAAVALSAALAPTGAGPAEGQSSRVTVPNVHCRRLDVAESIMHSHHLRVRDVGGGVFGIVVKSNWFVVRQRPRAGSRVARRTRVSLFVSRSC